MYVKELRNLIDLQTDEQIDDLEDDDDDNLTAEEQKLFDDF